MAALEEEMSHLEPRPLQSEHTSALEVLAVGAGNLPALSSSENILQSEVDDSKDPFDFAGAVVMYKNKMVGPRHQREYQGKIETEKDLPARADDVSFYRVSNGEVPEDVRERIDAYPGWKLRSVVETVLQQNGRLITPAELFETSYKEVYDSYGEQRLKLMINEVERRQLFGIDILPVTARDKDSGEVVRGYVAGVRVPAPDFASEDDHKETLRVQLTAGQYEVLSTLPMRSREPSKTTTELLSNGTLDKSGRTKLNNRIHQLQEKGIPIVISPINQIGRAGRPENSYYIDDTNVNIEVELVRSKSREQKQPQQTFERPKAAASAQAPEREAEKKVPERPAPPIQRLWPPSQVEKAPPAVVQKPRQPETAFSRKGIGRRPDSAHAQRPRAKMTAAQPVFRNIRDREELEKFPRRVDTYGAALLLNGSPAVEEIINRYALPPLDKPNMQQLEQEVEAVYAPGAKDESGHLRKVVENSQWHWHRSTSELRNLTSGFALALHEYLPDEQSVLRWIQKVARHPQSEEIFAALEKSFFSGTEVA